MYKLTVTPKQLAVIQAALENYFRTRMGQYFDLVSDIAFAPKEVWDKTPNSEVEEKDEIDNISEFARRNAAKELMDAAYKVCVPPGMYMPKSPEMLIAEDIWRVIRHQLWKERPPEQKNSWTVDSAEPLHVGSEPSIRMEKIETE